MDYLGNTSISIDYIYSRQTLFDLCFSGRGLMNNCWLIALAYLRVSPEKVSPAVNRAVAGQRVVLVEEVTVVSVEPLICVVL